jgi:hypothetical protein
MNKKSERQAHNLMLYMDYFYAEVLINILWLLK